MIHTTVAAQEVELLRGFFGQNHLAEDLRWVARLFGDLADELAARLPHDELMAYGLQHLLAAKDWYVRAAVAARREDVSPS